MIAFIIPVHPPKYDYLYNFINQVKDVFDLYVVFSNESDYNEFLLKEKIRPIIIMEPIPTSREVVTLKKFYGLKRLMNSHYDYFMVYDAETDIIPHNFTVENVTSKVEKIFADKQFYSAPNVYQNFAHESALSFNPKEYSIIESVTNHFNSYLWFGDIPVYRKTDLPNFFKYIKGKPYNNFDHMIYQYYLIVFENFKIIDATVFLEWIKSITDTQVEHLKNIGYGFGHINHHLFFSNPKFFLDHGTFIIYNTDR